MGRMSRALKGLDATRTSFSNGRMRHVPNAKTELEFDEPPGRVDAIECQTECDNVPTTGSDGIKTRTDSSNSIPASVASGELSLRAFSKIARSISRDSFDRVLHRVRLTGGNDASVVLTFVTADDRTSASETVASLGVLLSRAYSHRVLVVDADLSSCELTRRFECTERSGLTDVCGGKIFWQEAILSAAESEFALLPAGSRSPAPIVFADKFSELIDQWRYSYQFVLIDAGDHEQPHIPPLLRETSAGFMVVRLGETRRYRAHAAEHRLRMYLGDRLSCIVMAEPEKA